MDGWKVIDVVYSGRNSWTDVQAMQQIGSREAVLVVKKNGKRHKGRLTHVADASVKMTQSKSSTEISKDDIAQVWYIREKPLSAEAERAS